MFYRNGSILKANFKISTCLVRKSKILGTFFETITFLGGSKISDDKQFFRFRMETIKCVVVGDGAVGKFFNAIFIYF
jgi:hypothetical protein